MKKIFNTNSILKGSLILVSASLISKIIGVLYRIPITNILGDDGVAIYANAYQIYILLLTISAIGVPSAIAKILAECIALDAYKDAKKVYHIALLSIGGLSAFFSIVMWSTSGFIAAHMSTLSGLGLSLKVFAPTVFIASILAIIRGYFQGFNNMYPTAISQVVEQIFNAVFSIVFANYFIRYGISVGAAGSAMGTCIGAISGLIVILVIYYIHKPEMNRKLKNTTTYLNYTTKQILNRIISTVIPMILVTSIFSLLTIFDSYILLKKLPHSINYLREMNRLNLVPINNAHTLDTTVIVASLSGQYLNKYIPIINIPVSIILIICTSAIPSISASITKKNYKELIKKIKFLLRTGLFWACPATIGLTIFADPIIQFLYPNEPNGGALLTHGAIVIIFITIAQLTTTIFQGMGRQFIPIINVFIASSIKIIMNICLLSIPALTIYPIIYSTTICYVLFSLLNIFSLKHILKINFKWNKIFLKPFIASLCMGAIIYWFYRMLNLLFKYENINLMISIFISLFLYLFIYKLLTLVAKIIKACCATNK